MTVIWGVDPGLTGALAVTMDLKLIELIDLEDFADRGRLLPVALRERLRQVPMPGPGPDLVVLEDASTRPSQDAGATLTTGRTFGHLEGLIVGMGFTVRVVRSEVWKGAMALPAKVDHATTEYVVQMAESYFPLGAFRGPKGGLWDDRAEAALLTVWAWKYVLGGGPLPTKASALERMLG